MNARPNAGDSDETHPDASLSLESIRTSLCRLEETILFGLIERARYRHNPAIYEPDGVGPFLAGENLVGFLLRDCERSHARVRRYLSPDEIPFYSGLPPPLLPGLEIPNPLRAEPVNLNPELRMAYERQMVPFLCRPGDDRQWGSSAVNDVALLQAMSKRVHYGHFVAECKFRRDPERFGERIRSGDADALLRAVTDPDAESLVLDRVRRKAAAYGAELSSGPDGCAADPDKVREIYHRWLIPLNKQVQVRYLLGRRPDPS
jgi:chorismate mutase